MSDNSFKVGDKVSHEIFGEGIVLQIEFFKDYGESIQVKFERVGVKQIIVSYGKLTKIENQEPIKKKPNLTLVRTNMENTNTGDTRIKTQNFTQNVEKIEHQAVQVVVVK